MPDEIYARRIHLNEDFQFGNAEELSEKEYTKLMDSVGTKVALHMLTIPRKDAEAGKLQVHINAIEKVEKLKIKGKDSIALSFDGYDNDIRGIFEIREIRSFFQRLYKIKPNIFYYLIKYDLDYIKTLFLCLVELTVVSNAKRLDGQVDLDIVNAKSTIERLVNNAVGHAKKLGESTEEQFKLAELLYKALEYDNAK